MNRVLRVVGGLCWMLTTAPHFLVAESFESFSEPYRHLDLAPAESGLLVELNVREGDEVAIGQSLAALDREVLVIAREIAAATLQGEGKLQAAAAECDLRRERLSKLRKLRTQGHAGGDEVARAEADLAVADGQRLALEEQRTLERLELRKIEALLERRIIRSPIAGVVVRLHREQGEFVTPAAPTVATVAELHPLRLTFHLPPAVAAQLKAGNMQEVRFPDDADADAVLAKIETVLPIVDADSGTVRVKLLVDNHDRARQAGQRCTLTMNNAATAPTTTRTPIASPDLTTGVIE